MRPPFRSKQDVVINAPLEAVWAFSMDLTKIPEFHPRVVKVDLLAGKSFREPGVSYQCHLSGGKHTCIEQDIEIVPLEKIVTVLPQDTFGISKILSDYRVETTFQKLDDSATKVEISHCYSTTTLKAKVLNLIAKGQNCSRDSSNFDVGQSCNRSRSAHRTGVNRSRNSDELCVFCILQKTYGRSWHTGDFSSLITGWSCVSQSPSTNRRRG